MSDPQYAVAFSICKSILVNLSGFRGYPKPGPGEDYFVKALQAAVISVDHARAVVASFTGTFPTIQEIRDAASNLRPQFIPPVDQRAQWEAEYGKPQPFDVSPMKDRHELPDAALWREIMKREEFKGPGGHKKLQATSWTKLAAIAREIGGFDEYAAAWERS